MPGPGTVLWVWCVALCSFTRLNFAPINTLSLFVSCIVPLWTANSFYVSFLFRLVCFVTSVSLHMYFVMRVCWFVCLLLRLRIFGMMLLKIGYRILNCIINFWSLIFGFYLSLGDPSSSFQGHFCCSYRFICSFLFGIRLFRWLFLLVFVFWSSITDFAKTGQVSDDTIKLIN